MSFKELLSEKCECEKPTKSCCTFQKLKHETISVLNRMAQDNSDLRNQLEKLKIQLENVSLEKAQAQNVRENGKSQLVSLPEPFSLHPAQGKVPIRNKGRNGKPWSHYRDRLKDAFGIYEDVACVAISEMMSQGFTDHDILDALLPCANGDRRLSTHNAGPCHHQP
jgi:hypothetical protein